MISSFRSLLVLASVAIVLVAGAASCTKEYVDKINTIPGDTVYVSGHNYISSFEIKEYSKDTVLKASITADSIVVYWPVYSRALPDSIAPTITLPDGASILPASGKKVAFKTGTTYLVTSAAGTTKKYVLKVSQQAAVPWFYYNPPQMNLGDYLSLSGDQFWQDTSKTQVYMVSVKTGLEYKAAVFAVALGGPRFVIPLNVPTDSKYDIKVVNGAFTLYNTTDVRRNDITVVYPTTPAINTAGLVTTAARGDSFTVRGVLLSNVTTAFLYDGAVYTPIEVVSTAIDRVVVRIPASVPLGAYTRVRVVTSDGITRNVTSPITITP